MKRSKADRARNTYGVKQRHPRPLRSFFGYCPHTLSEANEAEKSRLNGFVGYRNRFLQEEGKFSEGKPSVGCNDIFIIEIPPRASPDLLSLDPNRWQKTPLFTLSHTELSYQLFYTSFHTAESAESNTQLSLTASSRLLDAYSPPLWIQRL